MIIWLASYPKSGNRSSWIFTLEQANNAIEEFILKAFELIVIV